MAQKRKHYSKQFKIDAVKLITEQGYKISEWGYPKTMRNRGWKVGKNRVADRMRKTELRSVVRRKFRTTTDSKHQLPVAPNLLERDFTANAPNQVWVSDISYIPTRNGWAYLTVFIDLFSRIVTGWSLSSSLSHEMVLTALYRAIRRRQPAEGLIIHSDRGVQYVLVTVSLKCLKNMDLSKV